MADAAVPPHWLPVPADLGRDDELLQWTMGVVDTLAEAWGERWREAFRRPIAELVFAVGGARDADDGPKFLCWPLPGPITTSVTITVARSSTLPDWEAEGFRVIPYEAQHLGRGILCTRERVVGEGDERTDLVQATYVFDDGDVCVAVTVGECVVRFAGFLDGDVDRLLQSLRIVDAAGTTLRGVESRAVVAGSYDRWMAEAS